MEFDASSEEHIKLFQLRFFLPKAQTVNYERTRDYGFVAYFNFEHGIVSLEQHQGQSRAHKRLITVNLLITKVVP